MIVSPSNQEPALKKRKLRKGTHSCWECKRRKAKCILTTSEGVCVGCRYRGTECVSQEEEDVRRDGATKATDRRLERVESMLEVLLEQQRGHKDASITRTASNSPHDEIQAYETVIVPNNTVSTLHNSPMLQSPTPTLTETLQTLIPSPRECQKICDSAKFATCFFLQLLTRDYLTISASLHNKVAADVGMSTPPTLNMHPVLLAQKLLMLACLSQYSSGGSIVDEQHWKARSRAMATAATKLVNTKDHLVLNAEGLECLMLEATYYYNDGNLREAFTSVRRAMALAQLLGIHRSVHPSIQQVDDSSPRFDPAYMWYRILYVDRLLCLVLGLPQGSPDTKFANTEVMYILNIEERLEREHCVLASRILDRNEREDETWTLTKDIDKSLQDLASSVPPEWWHLPTASQVNSPSDKFYFTGRLVNQLFHFSLINQTHLPYIFRPVVSKKTALNDILPANYGYSKTLCWTSSREVFARYLILIDLDFVAHAYTFADFFALIAAVTVLLLHIDHHWKSQLHSTSPPSFLSHMRSSDLAKIQKILHHMRTKPTSSTSTKGPRILQELLAVEEESFQFKSVGAGSIVKDDNADERPFFEIKIPYYGILRLSARKICFQKGGEFEDVKTSVRMLEQEESDRLEGGEAAGNEDAVLGRWVTDTMGSEFGEGDFGGLEMAFFESLQGIADPDPIA